MLSNYIHEIKIASTEKGVKSQVATEMKMSSFWLNFHHWLHWKLSTFDNSAASDENLVKMTNL